MAHIDKRPYVGRDGKEKTYWRARYPQGKERVKTFARRVDAERFLTGIEHAKLRGVDRTPAREDPVRRLRRRLADHQS